MTLSEQLKTAEPGDVLVLRCGGRVEFSRIVSSGLYIAIKGHLGCWFLNGMYYEDEECPLDIVAIEKKPFDWASVQWGQAFKDGSKLLWFIGRAIDGRMVFDWDSYAGEYGQWSAHNYPDQLKRSPSDDLPQAKE